MELIQIMNNNLRRRKKKVEEVGTPRGLLRLARIMQIMQCKCNEIEKFESIMLFFVGVVLFCLG